MNLSRIFGVRLSAAAVLAVLVLSSFATVAGATIATTSTTAASIPGPTPEYSAWQQQITSLAPPSAGCFEASYPVVQWIAGGSNCVTPPSTTLTVGGGTDYEGQIASGNHIGEAQGYVSGFSGFSSESDGSFGTNYYSLQDDSNEFSTTYSGTSVTVWQQFVFQNDPGSSSGYVFIQYWLLNYYSTYGSCPSTHTYLTAWGQSGNNCFANSNTSYSTPQENPSGLQSYEQKGYADNGGYDESVFCNGGTCYAEAVTYTVFDLAASWTVSEWNVLGFGAGSTADFSSGTSITVTQYLYNSGGTNTAVSCASNSGTSLEKNNLSLSPNCYTVTSTNYDYMYFTES